MTAHQLAAKLLTAPDIPVVLFAPYDAYEVSGYEIDNVSFNGERDTADIPRDKHDAILPRKCLLFEICRDAPLPQEVINKRKTEAAAAKAQMEADRVRLTPVAFGLKYATIQGMTPEMFEELGKQERSFSELINRAKEFDPKNPAFGSLMKKP